MLAGKAVLLKSSTRLIQIKGNYFAASHEVRISGERLLMLLDEATGFFDSVLCDIADAAIILGMSFYLKVERLYELLLNDVGRHFVAEDDVEIEASEVASIASLRDEGAEPQLDVWKHKVEIGQISGRPELANPPEAINEEVVSYAEYRYTPNAA